MKKILILTSLLFIHLTIFSIPAKKGFRKFIQPNGEQISVQLKGDEFYHYYETSDGIILKRDSAGYLRYAVMQDNELIAGKYIAKEPTERNSEEQEYIQSINISQTNQTVVSRRNQIVARRASIRKSNDFPCTGEVHGLVLLVAFKDQAFSLSDSDAKAHYNEMMNSNNYTYNGATGSAKKYFMDQSLNRFTPTFDVIGPITLNNNYAYYGQNDTKNDSDEDLRPGQMIYDACVLAKQSFGVDFSKYDYNNDGNVDLVYVVYAGYGEAQSHIANTIWPHSWDIVSQGLRLTIDNKLIYNYACSNELIGKSGTTIDGIGTFCHEFSHCLGLPDFYVTKGEANNFGMGEWDLMDYGCYANDSKTPVGYNAFERKSVGWLDLTELNASQSVSLNPLNTSNEAYAIFSDVNRNEYFIFENRQLSGWDSHLPYHGLLITHVDFSQSAWSNNTVNNEEGHQRFSIVPADNELLIYDGNNAFLYAKSLSGDPYPGKSGNNQFTDSSTPAATLFTGGLLSKPVTEIKETNGVITFEFMKGTGFENIRESDNITVENGLLHIKNLCGQFVSIYQINGMLYKTVVLKSDNEYIKCENGIFIVQIKDKVVKICIQQ